MEHRNNIHSTASSINDDQSNNNNYNNTINNCIHYHSPKTIKCTKTQSNRLLGQAPSSASSSQSLCEINCSCTNLNEHQKHIKLTKHSQNHHHHPGQYQQQEQHWNPNFLLHHKQYIKSNQSPLSHNSNDTAIDTNTCNHHHQSDSVSTIVSACTLTSSNHSISQEQHELRDNNIHNTNRNEDNCVTCSIRPSQRHQHCTHQKETSLNTIQENDNERSYISCIEHYSSDGADSGVKFTTDGGTSEEELGPPLPPRPRNQINLTNITQNRHTVPHNTVGVRKYVIWCLICGGMLCLLGIMFLGVYFLVKSYTSTVGYFETVPTFVPATLLLLTGICVISLIRRRNRYSFLMKLSLGCGFSAVMCALITGTTTILHINRLQTLNDCEYSKRTRTCTCTPMVNDPNNNDDGIDDVTRFVFDSSEDCKLTYNALYTSLRAVFGLSVAGVLVAGFSLMLVYLLFSHERKKMYWEQLELRCRSLYTSPQSINNNQNEQRIMGTGVSGVGVSVGSSGSGGISGGGGGGGNGGGPSIIGTSSNVMPCRCCEQCHSHRNTIPSSAFTWLDTNGDTRFWFPGQTGNFYSPNPGGDEHNTLGRQTNSQITQRTQRPGWSWPRMPWQRNDIQRFRQTPSSPDSQYGFSNTQQNNISSSGSNNNDPNDNTINQNGYTVIGGTHYSIWGPPPPYSDPNSPARRIRYQYFQHMAPPALTQCQHSINQTSYQQSQITNHNNNTIECHQNRSQSDSNTIDLFNLQQQQNQSQQHHHQHQQQQQQQQQQQPNNHQQQQVHQRNMLKRQVLKSKNNYENEPSDSDCGGQRDRFSNTLPIRKNKKRVEIGAKSIGPNQSSTHVNVQNIFGNENQNTIEVEHEYHEPLSVNINGIGSDRDNNIRNNFIQKQKYIKNGVENNAFLSIETHNSQMTTTNNNNNGGGGRIVISSGHGDESGNSSSETNNNRLNKLLEPSESEVYFADVSSCCNISVKNDNFYDDAMHKQFGNEQINEFSIQHRFGGQRETSIRNNLPFSQKIISENYEKSQINLPIIVKQRSSPIAKDVSRQSMCSIESEEKTDFTDLSPVTPCSSSGRFINISDLTIHNIQEQNEKFNQNTGSPIITTTSMKPSPTSPKSVTTKQQVNTGNCQNEFLNGNTANNFVATFPYSTSEQSHEAHHRHTKNLPDIFLPPDAQYELERSTTNNENNTENIINSNNVNNSNKFSLFQAQKSPKHMNKSPIKRHHLGTNISAIIHNLNGSDMNLMYSENRLDSKSDSDHCSNDTTTCDRDKRL